MNLLFSSMILKPYLNEMLYPVECVGKRTHVTLVNKQPKQFKTVYVNGEEKQKKLIK